MEPISASFKNYTQTPPVGAMETISTLKVGESLPSWKSSSSSSGANADVAIPSLKTHYTTTPPIGAVETVTTCKTTTLSGGGTTDALPSFRTSLSGGTTGAVEGMPSLKPTSQTSHVAAETVPSYKLSVNTAASDSSSSSSSSPSAGWKGGHSGTHQSLYPQPPPFPKMGSGGKRVAPGPLNVFNSSDEEDTDATEQLDTLPSPSVSPRSPRPRLSRVDVSLEALTARSDSRTDSPHATFACEHDHDYENVASPSSSTASGPIYDRPPGFKFHAQEVLSGKAKIKKKKTASLVALREGLKKREPTPPKVKPKKEPLPMKLRALPQSFWQQPNVPHQVSPASAFPILPPLMNRDSEEDVMDVRPVTPPEDRERERKRVSERKITVADTDLLFRLFDGVGEEKKASSMKRGRPRRTLHKSSTSTKGLLCGNDPYLVDAMADKLFPQLSLEMGKQSVAGNTSLQLITFNQGDKAVTLPSLSIDQNYSQMLSELVTHI